METRTRSEYDIDLERLGQDYNDIRDKILSDETLEDWQIEGELYGLQRSFECRVRWLVEGEQPGDHLIEENGLGEYL